MEKTQNAEPVQVEPDAASGYAAWMNATWTPHDDDKRHPFDAFKAGAEWATMQRGPLQGERQKCASCGRFWAHREGCAAFPAP